MNTQTPPPPACGGIQGGLFFDRHQFKRPQWLFFTGLVFLLSLPLVLLPSLALGNTDLKPDRSAFNTRFANRATGEVPCVTATVQAGTVILPATWCLTLGDPGRDPTFFITRGNPQSHWLRVFPPLEIPKFLVDSKLLPDPRRSRTLKNFTWLNHSEWWLVNEFYWPSGHISRNQALVFDRLVGATGIWLNGRELTPVEDGFISVRCELGALLSSGDRNRLAIQFRASEGEAICPPNQSRIRLYRCGLGGAARIVAEPDIQLEAVGARVTMATDSSSGAVDLDIRVRKRSPGEIQVHTYAILRLPDKPGRLPLHHWWGRPETVKPGLNRFRLTLVEKNPVLWWPLGEKNHHLYSLKVQIRQGPAVLAERDLFIAFRSTRWNEKGELFINGQPVVIKATEWDPGGQPASEAELVVRLGRLASANLNAVWVRAPSGFESDLFYDICDRAGILVLQQIPPQGRRLDSNRILDLERHPSVVAWTRKGAVPEPPLPSGANPLTGLDHLRPVLTLSPLGKGKGLPVVNALAAPHPRTWEDLLDRGDRWPMPLSWRSVGPDVDALEAELPHWGTAETYTPYSLLTQTIQAERLREMIEQTRVENPVSGGLITGKLRASWPGLSPALFDVLDRPSIGFWQVRRSWEPAVLVLRRKENQFEAWVVNTGSESITGNLTLFDALSPSNEHQSVARVSVPPGTAALVWSSTQESWEAKAIREGNLKILGAIVGESMTTTKLAEMSLPSLLQSATRPIRDPRLPPVLQASLFCAAPAEIELPTATLHIITFAEDGGPWRVTIRSFGRKYLRQARLVFSPPTKVFCNDQFFDIVPGGGRLITIYTSNPPPNMVRVTVSAENAVPVVFQLRRK